MSRINLNDPALRSAGTYNASDTVLQYAADGSPLIPLDPETAAARLRALDATSEVVDALLDRRHPQHNDRAAERRALQAVVAGKRHS